VDLTGRRVTDAGDALRRSFSSLTVLGDCNARVGLTGQRVANGSGALHSSFSSLSAGVCNPAFV
jgi:hypothetical protein